MIIEIYRNRQWIAQEVTGRQVGRHWVEDDNTIHSPAYWRPQGSSKGFWLPGVNMKRAKPVKGQSHPKEYMAGPFTCHELDLAEKIAKSQRGQIIKFGTRWWVV